MIDIPLDEPSSSTVKSSDKSSENMSDMRHRRRYYGGATTSYGLGSAPLSTSATSSALDRLRSNLSPVSSYCRPILRTFDGVLPNKVSIFDFNSFHHKERKRIKKVGDYIHCDSYFLLFFG